MDSRRCGERAGQLEQAQVQAGGLATRSERQASRPPTAPKPKPPNITTALTPTQLVSWVGVTQHHSPAGGTRPPTISTPTNRMTAM